MNKISFDFKEADLTEEEIKERTTKTVLKNMDLSELISYEVDFTIKINDIEFFSEPYFDVYEFLFYTEKWSRAEEVSDMHYIAIDTEDNPLISFLFTNEGWKIYSPWQLFQCNYTFSKNELVDVCRKLMKNLNITWE